MKTILIKTPRAHLYIALLLSVCVFLGPLTVPIGFWGLIGPCAAAVFAAVLCVRAVSGHRELLMGEKIASVMLLLFDLVVIVYLVRVIVGTKAFADA